MILSNEITGQIKSYTMLHYQMPHKNNQVLNKHMRKIAIEFELFLISICSLVSKVLFISFWSLS